MGTQGMQITNQAVIYALRPDARSRINSAYMVCYFLGGAAGSLAAGALYGAHGWAGVCLLGAGFGLLTLAMSAYDRLRPARAARSAEPVAVLIAERLRQRAGAGTRRDRSRWPPCAIDHVSGRSSASRHRCWSARTLTSCRGWGWSSWPNRRLPPPRSSGCRNRRYPLTQVEGGELLDQHAAPEHGQGPVPLGLRPSHPRREVPWRTRAFAHVSCASSRVRVATYFGAALRCAAIGLVSGCCGQNACIFS